MIFFLVIVLFVDIFCGMVRIVVFYVKKFGIRDGLIVLDGESY